MKSESANSRRSFLKKTAAAAAGIVASQGLTEKVFARTSSWTDRMAINPAISNLRVVCCLDPTMVKSTPTSWSFTSQNNAVDAARVKANMDEMAKSLAQKATAAEAWAAIFQKPAAKQWSAVKVAIKFNSICCGTENTVRAAVIGKVCDALIGLGVAAGNITAYDVDNSQQGAIQYLTPYIGAGKEIPAGVLVSSHLGGSTPSPVPGYGNQDCRTQLANGTIDILVNTGTNRGHGDSAGFSLMLKSHMGTFPAKHGDMTYVTAMSKADAIVGGTPPRQQLCIIDSLFATCGGPGGAPDFRLNRIVMGTFAPPVDYLVARKLRQVYMTGWAPSQPSFGKVATDFGYTIAEFDALDLVTVPPAGSTGAANHTAPQPGQSRVSFAVHGNGFLPSTTDLVLGLPSDGNMDVAVSIQDMKGRLVRTFAMQRSSKVQIVWDGVANSGIRVPAGTYIVNAQCGSSMQTVTIALAKQ